MSKHFEPLFFLQMISISIILQEYNLLKEIVKIIEKLNLIQTTIYVAILINFVHLHYSGPPERVGLPGQVPVIFEILTIFTSFQQKKKF